MLELFKSWKKHLFPVEEKEEEPKTVIDKLELITKQLDTDLLINRVSTPGNVLSIESSFPNVEQLILMLLDNTDAVEKSNKEINSWLVEKPQTVLWLHFLTTNDLYKVDEYITFPIIKDAVLRYCETVRKYSNEEIGDRAYILRRLGDFDNQLYALMCELYDFSLK